MVAHQVGHSNTDDHTPFGLGPDGVGWEATPTAHRAVVRLTIQEGTCEVGRGGGWVNSDG